MVGEPAVRQFLVCRPDYKKLGVLKQQFPDVPILALTATATRRVCQDLKEILRISACETFHTSIDRPNLYYSVRYVTYIFAQVSRCRGLDAFRTVRVLGGCLRHILKGYGT